MAGSRVPSVGAGMAGKGVLAVAWVALAMASCGDGAPVSCGGGLRLRTCGGRRRVRWERRRGASGAAMGAHREGSSSGDGSDGQGYPNRWEPVRFRFRPVPNRPKFKI